jgi:hypothetical protein
MGEYGIRACRLALCSPRPADKAKHPTASGHLSRLPPPSGPAGLGGPGSTL